MRCTCDKCSATLETRAPGEAWTPDGYCHFCDRFCFPSFVQAGQPPGRLKTTTEARARLHGTTVPPKPAASFVIAPDARPYVPRIATDFAISLITDDAWRTGLKVGMAVMDELAPHLAPGARRVFGEVAKRLPKRRKRK